MRNIHTPAQRHLPGDYTVENIEFTDGDERPTATHSIGHGELGCRTDLTVREHRREIWVEYYEHGVRRDRRQYGYDLRGRAI